MNKGIMVILGGMSGFSSPSLTQTIVLLLDQQEELFSKDGIIGNNYYSLDTHEYDARSQQRLDSTKNYFSNHGYQLPTSTRPVNMKRTMLRR
ncbi:MAG: hypothetical protein VX028_00115 [Nanoarchaeota archaeon]|nr:hypothetical protein [Nanoarchaeota archaeon]MEC8339674.1 hypothetical protein [Nanoarchaeota archaeon]